MEDHQLYSMPFFCSENVQEEEAPENSETRDFDALLIDLVKGSPHLFNKVNANFKDAHMKENSWQEIANVLNASVAECKNRWARLRERFSREKKYIEDEYRSGSGASHRQIWPLYTNMEFLKPHVAGRKTLTNVTRTNVQNNENTNFLELPVPSAGSNLEKSKVIASNGKEKQPSNPKFSQPQHISFEGSTITEQPKVVASTSNCNAKAIRPSFKRQKVQDNVDLSIMNLSAAVTSHLSSNPTQPSQSSEDTFAKLIAEELSKFEEPRKTQKKREILKVVYDF